MELKTFQNPYPRHNRQQDNTSDIYNPTQLRLQSITLSWLASQLDLENTKNLYVMPMQIVWLTNISHVYLLISFTSTCCSVLNFWVKEAILCSGKENLTERVLQPSVSVCCSTGFTSLQSEIILYWKSHTFLQDQFFAQFPNCHYICRVLNQ